MDMKLSSTSTNRAMSHSDSIVLTWTLHVVRVAAKCGDKSALESSVNRANITLDATVPMLENKKEGADRVQCVEKVKTNKRKSSNIMQKE